MKHPLLRAAFMALALLTASAVGPPAGAQTPPAAPACCAPVVVPVTTYVSLPDTLLTCQAPRRRHGGQETCLNEELPAEAVTAAREALTARVPQAGGLFPEEYLHTVTLRVTHRADGLYAATVTLYHQGGGTHQFHSVHPFVGDAIRSVVTLSLPNPATNAQALRRANAAVGILGPPRPITIVVPSTL